MIAYDGVMPGESTAPTGDQTDRNQADPSADSTHPADRLAEAIDRAGTPACVGIDPVADRLPGELAGASVCCGFESFCAGVLQAVAGVVPAVKFQSACFERYGAAGVAVLEEAVDRARQLGLFVILDAKRGDIGISARHYAAAAVGMGADAITANAYLGAETIEPYLEAGLMVYPLVRTSNPGSDAIQRAALADGRTVAQLVASEIAALGAAHHGARGLSAVGAVVGLTKSKEGKALRTILADQPMLVPGYGAQGGTAAQVRALCRPGTATNSNPGELGVLVTASRSVIYAPDPTDAPWPVRVRDAASRMVGQLAGAITSK